MLDAMTPHSAAPRFRHDSFIVGANLPWLTYGCDFGASRWFPDGGIARPDVRTRLRDALTALADAGATHVRWFLFCDGRSGMVTGHDDGLLGLDEHVRRDVEAALAELDRAGMSVIFVLFDFLWFAPARFIEGVQVGGRGSWLTHQSSRQRTLDTTVAPVLGWTSGHQTVAAWDIINEPEWVSRRCASRDEMRAFIGDVRALVHELTPHAATVGLASARGLPLVRGLGLDVYQVHWYDRFDRRTPLERPVSELGADAPVLLGEFPTRASRRAPPDIIRVAREAGYAGALAWSAQASDGASDASALASALGDFRRA
jgi:hypothetical protein